MSYKRKPERSVSDGLRSSKDIRIDDFDGADAAGDPGASDAAPASESMCAEEATVPENTSAPVVATETVVPNLDDKMMSTPEQEECTTDTRKTSSRLTFLNEQHR
jgi:hypothetical protein